jgi:hypothetical protein
LRRASTSVRALLTNLTRWVADRYDSKGLGLADVRATPEEEIFYLLAAPMHVGAARRLESYISTVILDLAAVLELGDIYELARNEFLAVRALPGVLEVGDTTGQYVIDEGDLRFESNMPYKNKWEPEDDWKVAPHHVRGPSSLYLERVGRAWDVLAIASVLRDRHFVKCLRRIACEDASPSSSAS